MDVALLTSFATPFMGMLAMLSHQQRPILKQLSDIGERLARIEGYRGIGMRSPDKHYCPVRMCHSPCV